MAVGEYEISERELELQLEHRMGDKETAQSVAPVLRSDAKTARLSDVAVIWAGANLVVATWSLGSLATTVFGLDMTGALWSIIVGNIIGGIVLGIAAIMGKTGSPQMILGRYAYGIKGNYITSVFQFVTATGWFTVNTILTALSAYALLHILGIPTTTVVEILVLAILLGVAIYVALAHFHIMKTVEHVIAWPVLALTIVMTYRAIVSAHWSIPANGPATGSGFNYWMMWISAAAAIGIGNLGGWAPYAADFTRYFPFAKGKSSDRSIFWTTLIVGAVTCIWLELVGAVFGAMYKTVDPAVFIAKQIPLLAVPALIVVIGGLLTSNIVNLVSGSLAAKAISRFGSRTAWALIMGIIGSFLAFYAILISNIAGAFSNFLTFLLIWEAPWAGVLFVDYFIVRKQKYSVADLYEVSGRIPGFNRAGLISYVAGFAVTWFLSFTGTLSIFGIPLYSQFALNHLNGGDIGYIAGLAVAGLLYLALTARQGPVPALEEAAPSVAPSD